MLHYMFRTVVIGCLIWMCCLSVCNAAPHSQNGMMYAPNRIDGPSPTSKMDAVKRIIRQMAPIIICSPNEASQCCFPGDPIEFWQNHAILSTLDRSKTFDPDQSAWVEGLHPEWIGVKHLPTNWVLASGQNFVTQARKNPFPKTFNPGSPCWCEWYFDEPYLLVKYWFWWSFNDHPNDSTLNPFDHEGDWEHVEVRAKLIDNQHFNYVYFLNRHGKPKMVVPTRWSHSDGFVFIHPKVWIAEGSHAPYEDPSMSENLDNVADSSLIIDASQNLRFKDEELNNPVWNFTGTWGDLELTPKLFGHRVTDPPTGPAARDRYENTSGRDEFP